MQYPCGGETAHYSHKVSQLDKASVVEVRCCLITLFQKQTQGKRYGNLHGFRNNEKRNG